MDCVGLSLGGWVGLIEVIAEGKIVGAVLGSFDGCVGIKDGTEGTTLDLGSLGESVDRKEGLVEGEKVRAS
jgi:hypothetical protein